MSPSSNAAWCFGITLQRQLTEMQLEDGQVILTCLDRDPFRSRWGRAFAPKIVFRCFTLRGGLAMHSWPFPTHKMGIIRLLAPAVPQSAPPGSEPSSGIAERIEGVQHFTEA